MNALLMKHRSLAYEMPELWNSSQAEVKARVAFSDLNWSAEDSFILSGEKQENSGAFTFSANLILDEMCSNIEKNSLFVDFA